MGRLVIAHHKSYHPYRRDNVERVRRDEEEAHLKEEQEEGRMMVADAEARIKVLRERAGEISKRKKRPTEKEEMEEAQRAARVHETSGLPVSGGHINFFGDVEQASAAAAAQSSRQAKLDVKEDEKGVRLAPSAKDLKPWYSSIINEVPVDERRRNRDEFRKSTHDPLTFINDRLSGRPGSSLSARPSSSRRPPPSSSSRARPPPPKDDNDPYAPALPQEPKPPVDPTFARLSRESTERARAQELLRRRQRDLTSTTPSTVYGGGDMYNRFEVEAAQAARRGDRDAGQGWDRRTRDRRW